MEVGAVNFIHGAEIPQILHKYCRLDDIVQRQTGLLQHGLQILERLVRLACTPSANAPVAGSRPSWPLQ